jgi:predicted nuclease of predicted toxin-antitoxin system
LRVLLDEQLDWRLGRFFGEGFEVETVSRRGWKGKKNGELLALMEEAGFDALVTVDRGIPHQQNLSRRAVAVVSLDARSPRLDDTAPIVEGNLERIRLAPPGKATRLP